MRVLAASVLVLLASLPVLADDWLPLSEARTGRTPEPDVWSWVEQRTLQIGRPDASDGIQVLVLPIEFPDVKGTMTKEELEEAFFTGDRSLAAYYRKVSREGVEVKGEVAPWVRAIVPKKYVVELPSVGFAEIYYRLLLDRLPDATRERLTDFDVLVFVIAGSQAPEWAGLLWPHAGPFADGTHVFEKIVLAEKGGKNDAFQREVLFHEFGHTLGIPDKYCYLQAFGIPHECEVQRVGRHCLMGWGSSPCAWCRIQMGWLEPTILATGEAQSLRLPPVEKGGGVAKIFLGSRSRYLLVSNEEGELRVLRLGEPWRRFKNHLLWIDLDCVVAEKLEAAKTFELAGGVRLVDAQPGDDGEIRLRVEFAE